MSSFIDELEINGIDYNLGYLGENDTQDADLVLSDPNEKNICVFQEGNIKTKNFDSSEHIINVKMEKGGIASAGYDDYSIDSFNNYSRTAYFIKTFSAKSVLFPVDGLLYQFSSDNTLISADNVTNGGRIILADNCSYIRFSVPNGDNECIQLKFYGGGIPFESKRVQLRQPSDRLVFEISIGVCTTARLKLPSNYTIDGLKVPLIIWDSGDGSFSNWDSELGAPGYAGRVNGLNYLCDQGFAILEIYSWGSYNYLNHNGCGNRSAMPLPSHLASHEKGVEYVLSRYNIDPENIFHLSKSGSGKIALYYALERPKFNLKSIYAMAPVFDDLNFVGWNMKGYREALFDELNMRGDAETEGTPAYQFINGTPIADGGYNGTGWAMHSTKGKQFINENADKFTVIVPGWMNLCGQTIAQKIQDTHDFSAAFWEGYTYDPDTQQWSWSDPTKYPATRGNVCYTRDNLVMIGNHIPIMVIMSPTDEQTPYWDAFEVVKQLLNGGDDASMYELADGGHSGPDLSISGANYVENITTRLGVHYEGVSIGWYVACEDIFARFLQNYLTE